MWGVGSPKKLLKDILDPMQNARDAGNIQARKHSTNPAET